MSKLSKNGEDFDNIILLQPTSPLRSKKDITNAFELIRKMNANAIVSVTEVDHSPLWSNTFPPNNLMDNFISDEILFKSRQS